VRSLTPAYLDALTFTAEEAATLQALGERRGRQTLFERQSPETLKSLLQHATVESITSSNRIEGVVAPQPRIEGIALKSTTPRGRSEQEIAGYRDALALVHENAQHMELAAPVLLQLHAMMYRYSGALGGQWKLLDNQIAETAPDGRVRRIRFLPVRWTETPQAIDDLARLYRDALAANRPALVVVPLAILDLLCIHPFTDGNGRVARLATVLLLHHANYVVGRYVSLDRIIEESKATYYEALERSSRRWHEGRHDARPWLRYFWGVVLRAYAEFEERVGAVDGARGAKTRHILAAVDRRIGPFSISEIERECPGTSREMVRLILRRLRDEGAIVPVGRGRGAKWKKKG
jgi:Fic family protein